MSKVWHENFLKYMNDISSHDNYKGLLIKRKVDGELAWVSSGKSKVGIERKKWADIKANELGIPNEPGVYAKVMFEIHPTKDKVCQICGTTMSIKYIYLNSSLVSRIEKEFDYECDTNTSLYEVIDDLSLNYEESELRNFLIKTFKLEGLAKTLEVDEIIEICETTCRLGSSKLLGPGAMSNFPDRFDGFHTYNRCCRSTEDKGRSKENLRTYSKDRRAYEYWSDGNLHAANQFMNSDYFLGQSADHVGPISLGFIHDPLFLKPMSVSDNSAKRDRLLMEDIENIISIENTNNINAISWYNQLIWKYIKENYKSNLHLIHKFRYGLKVNITNLMYILGEIIDKKERGIDFLTKTLIIPKMDYFNYDYKFDVDGNILERTKRNFTDATRKEEERFIRVSIESVSDYNNKNNRNLKHTLKKEHLDLLDLVKTKIYENQFELAYSILNDLIKLIQEDLIIKMK